MTVGVVTVVGKAAAGPAGPIEIGDGIIGFRIAGGYADWLAADEFAILMPGIALDRAREVCRSLSAMLSLSMMLPDGSVSVGASFGLHLVMDVNTSCDVALRAADAQLYRAKSIRHLDYVGAEPEKHGRTVLSKAR